MNRPAKVKKSTLLVWWVLPLCAKASLCVRCVVGTTVASGTGRGGARLDGWGFWKLPLEAFFIGILFTCMCLCICV